MTVIGIAIKGKSQVISIKEDNILGQEMHLILDFWETKAPKYVRYKN